MRAPRVLRELLPVAVAAAVVLTARASFADHYRVPSGSMEPTVHVGDRIVVAKAAYGLRLPLSEKWLVSFGLPARGDVVVIEPPEPTEEVASVLLKRVVALPGERVEVIGGRVYVEERLVDEPWVSLAHGPGPDFGPTQVPPHHVLVLGDNRGNSHDGRAFGFVAVEHVLGRASAIVARDGHLTYAPLTR